jgi:hypothetical protein
MERVLRWERDQREHLTCHLEDDYYAHIQRFDSNVAHLVRARTAIEPFSACECPKPRALTLTWRFTAGGGKA